MRAVHSASGLLQETRIERELTESSRIAREDPLTGLANRRGYEEAVAAPSDTPWGLILVDVDRFKGVNDPFGHVVGDAVLIRVAEISCEDLTPGLTASASVGWASLVDGETPMLLLGRADARMYRAKRARYR